MPKTTAPLSADELRAQADQLDAQAQAARAEITRRALESERRRLDAQRVFDEQFVAGYSRAELEADVDRAKAALDQALAENSLVVALADYATSLRRRSHGVLEHLSARGRLGLPTGTANAGPTELSGLDEYVIRAAERIASDRVAAEQAAFHARRETAGDNTTEENR